MEKLPEKLYRFVWSDGEILEIKATEDNLQLIGTGPLLFWNANTKYDYVVREDWRHLTISDVETPA